MLTSASLRPTPVTELGLAPAIADLIGFWNARRAEVQMSVELMDEQDLPEPLKDAAFRIVQEALSNAMRHASPSAVRIAIQPLEDREIEVVIADDGAGEGATGGGFGLIGNIPNERRPRPWVRVCSSWRTLVSKP